MGSIYTCILSNQDYIGLTYYTIICINMYIRLANFKKPLKDRSRQEDMEEKWVFMSIKSFDHASLILEIFGQENLRTIKIHTKCMGFLQSFPTQFTPI